MARLFSHKPGPVYTAAEPKAFNGGGRAPACARTTEDLGGRPLTTYKFRPMVQEAEELLPCLVNLGAVSEPVYKLENDPRLTPLESLLRKTSLDELPQLFKVPKGDTSLVGPRPEAMEVGQLYDENHEKRLSAKPGISGLQQVTYLGTKSMKERLNYDLCYIKHRSLLLDFRILFRTVSVVIMDNGAF